MLPIRFVTIHCAATPEGKHFSAAQITAMDMLRFKQPSYHWVVELDGTTVATLPEDQRGAHVAGHNTGNLGVCYVGGVAADGRTPMDTRTQAQKQALRVLIAELRARHGDVEVLGHRDWPDVTKACPSFDVATDPCVASSPAPRPPGSMPVRVGKPTNCIGSRDCRTRVG